MSFDAANLDNLMHERRAAVAESIHTISTEEMKALGEVIFPYVDHHWREKYFAFVNENASATFHHAITSDRAHILYCHAQQKGMWFVSGSGMGPLQAKGLQIMKEIVESGH